MYIYTWEWTSDEFDLTGDTIDRDLAWKRVGRMMWRDTLQILSAFACKFRMLSPSDLIVIFIATIIKSSQLRARYRSLLARARLELRWRIFDPPRSFGRCSMNPPSRSVRLLFSKNFSRFYQIRFDVSIV